MISQYLKLLADFLLDMPVVGIELAQSAFECVDVIELELWLADQLNAFHNFYQPASSLKSFLAKEERLLPLRKHKLFRLRLSIPNNEDFS